MTKYRNNWPLFLFLASVAFLTFGMSNILSGMSLEYSLFRRLGAIFTGDYLNLCEILPNIIGHLIIVITISLFVAWVIQMILTVLWHEIFHKWLCGRQL